MSLENHSRGPGAHASTSEPEHDGGGPVRPPQSAGTLTPSDPTRVAGVVHAEGVEYGYGVGSPVLRGVDLEIGVGEIVGIVGPVGAGKSTLLRILAGDLRPAAGEVTLPPRRSSGGRVMVGYAARESAHFEALSGWDNAMFFARAGGMRLRDAEAAVTELMEVLQFDDLAHVPVSEYSPDVRHRLLLVEALAHHPALSVLDDPFHGLELDTREALIHELRVRSAQRGTVVVASEDLTLIPELVDRLLFMHEGRIVAGGRVAELLGGVGSATRVDVELERRPQHFDPRFRPGITVVSDGDPYILDLTPGRATVSEALAALDAAGAHVRSAKVHEADLAEVFRRATGVELQS